MLGPEALAVLGGNVRNTRRMAGLVLLAAAALLFVLGAARVGFVVARATVGLYEAIIIAALGLVLYLTSRRES
jgi:hypothetical protein